jgi:PilZ domain
MHELRSIVTEGPSARLLAKRAPRHRQAEEGASLASLAIPRTEARTCNQRREDRHLNVVEQAEIRFRNRRHEVGIVNVSAHGAMIESGIEPRIGERMQIAFADCNRTECSVRWVRNGRIGVEFARETEIIASAKVKELVVSGRREVDGERPPEPKQPGRPPRQSLLWKAVLHWDHGTLQVRMRNISAEGAMLEASGDLPPDTGVMLDLGDGGSVPGIVRWARSGQLGIRFDERFDLRNLVRHDEPHEHSPSVVKPRYLESELDPDSPWAAAWDKLDPEDLDAAE